VTEATPPAGPDEPRRPETGRKRRLVGRWSRRTLALVVAFGAALLVLVVSVDLGRLFPAMRTEAEQYASRYLERPVHIGRLSASIVPGIFTLDDVVIEGKHPGDRPFFEARRVWAYVPLWSLVHLQLTVELRISDWRMIEELWPDGASQPRLGGPKRAAGGRKLPFTTTVFVYAIRGQFLYDDHQTPWSVDAANLGFSLVRAQNLGQYVGRAAFTDGTVQIQHYKPMRTDMTTRFVLDGPRVTLTHVDLVTDGSVSHVTGHLDFSRWPEQRYNVNSTVDFARMREIFFADQSWALGGSGRFTGVFELFHDGGRELAGTFTSEDATVDALGFPHLHGSLIWTRDRFAVTHADADLLGGTTRFSYEMAPLGRPGGSMATFAADYAGVDLARVNRTFSLGSLELAGRATGNIALEWPTGRFAEKSGTGHTVIVPPAGIEMAAESLAGLPRTPAPEIEPLPLAPLPMGADLDYRIAPDGWTFADSWAATPLTFVRFHGYRARQGASEFPFHVTSHDWQESDRVLARIMTAVAGPTGPIQVSGRGTFDGVMTGPFNAPRVAGRFESDATHVWDVTWGHAAAQVVIENHYVDISSGVVNGADAGARIDVNGRFFLGFSHDAREEIRARVVLAGWPVTDLRHAFQLDDWPMDGTIGLADLQLSGKYKEMFGTGRLRIDRGRAWGEPFDTAAGDVDLEGTGMRIHRMTMAKGPGMIRGDLRVGWDGTYSFNADGEDVPVESLENFRMPAAPLSGRLRFTAAGAAPFDAPAYTFQGAVDDLFVGDQGIGRVQGRLNVANNVLSIERLAANSSLLDVEGRGTIALDAGSDADLHLRFTQSSLDPYLKFFAPRISPYARAILSGAVDVTGPLSAPEQLAIDATVNDATLTLLDYDLRNDGPIHLTYAHEQFAVGQLKLQGRDTNLALTGTADAHARQWHLGTEGAASLSILQAFFRGITASGAATLNASLTGTFDAPRLTGNATVSDGRLRPLASIHSLEAINGGIRFDETGVNLDGLSGTIGNGHVDFDGNISVEGYRLSTFNLTARGRSMRLRYPAGFNSTVNMDLLLGGPVAAPSLTGTIDVLRVSLTGLGSGSGLLGFAAIGGGAAEPVPDLAVEAGTSIALDIQVSAPRTTFVNTKTARIEGTGDLRVTGTFDQPSIIGTVDILGGEATLYGNRYVIREGSIDFRNPNRIEPIFDLTTDTRAHVSGETYDVTVHVSGTMDQFSYALSSDPPLPDADIMSILLGGLPDVDTAEQRALRSPQETQQRVMQSAMANFVTDLVSSRVGDVAERTLALDTVQITPLLPGDAPLQQLNPTARVTLGKRISPRVFLTYSRTLSGPQDEIILLEYDENDRISWVLSRNENRTYALDFRIRYVH
jgi:hypothetical protein